ncbi:hypothetical protein [Thermohalobacter berrensis]|uniref:Uncharacterized protein n=1 Tax=Thermohalobacter berrensis TaxID=99594 RepID=A0A419SZF1_9FIRM|nr:hypothetical protein [Thermohalobacter berrensis]RKD30549.1 hypothetical protein BET03_04215 [Thermohalobacter berrensis]
MLEKNLFKYLKPIRFRIYLKRLIHYLSYATTLWSIMSLILMIISRFIPITFLFEKIMLLALMFLFLGILYSFYKRPSYREVALIVDSMGLKERVVTALELSKDNSVIAKLQKEDAIEYLKKINYKEGISIKPPVTIVLLSFVLILTGVLVSFIPTKSYITAQEIEENLEEIEDKKKEIEKVEKLIEKDNLLTKEEKEEIKRALERLRKKIDNQKEFKDITKEAIKTNKKINEIAKEIQDKKIKKLAKELGSEEFTRNLSKHLNNKDYKGLMEEIAKMEEQLKRMDKEEIKELSKKLKELSSRIENPKVSNVLNNIASTISGNMSDSTLISQNMNNLGETLSNIMNGENISVGLNKAISVTEGLKNTTSEAVALGNSNSNQSSSGNQNSSTGGNNGQGEGTGNGTSNGSNYGNSGSTGQGGNGASIPSEKTVENYEKVFAPSNLGVEGKESGLKGTLNKSGSEDIIKVKKMGDITGESVPYNEVINTYKKQAYEEIDSKVIPESMKEIVKKYFAEIAY